MYPSYKKRNPKGTSAKTTDQCSICVTTVCSAFNKWEYNNSPTSNKWRRWVLMIKTDQQIQWSGEQSVQNIQKQDIWDRWGSGGIHMADKSKFLIVTNYFWLKRQITHVQVNDTFLSFRQSEALSETSPYGFCSAGCRANTLQNQYFEGKAFIEWEVDNSVESLMV